MPTILQHNIMAMNADRQLETVTGSFAKSTEKLSSGYKINRAADDAAGLSISEKMRRQIRGLEQASKNIVDGISLCQIADGALNETTDILQRMRELAVQSANGTNSESDRAFIEMEIVQLKREVDRIAETTSFNEAIYPLNASAVSGGIQETPPSPPVNPPGGSGPSKITLKEQTVTFVTNTAFTHNGVSYNVGDTATITGMTTNGNEIRFDGGHIYRKSSSENYELALQTSNGRTFDVKKSNLKFDEKGAAFIDSQSTGTRWYYAYKINDGSPDPIAHGNGDLYNYLIRGYLYFTVDNLEGGSPAPVDPTPAVPPAALPSGYPIIYIKAGASADASNNIPIYVVNATCKGLGITDVTVLTEDSSAEAMNLLDGALAKVSSYRSSFGATQNRLEHAKKIDDNTAENTQAAESQIRDTDISFEMVRYSYDSILMQTGLAMLSQANQSRQSALRLLE